MKRFVKPMLATLVSKPFDQNGWLFEIKWDGYRAIAEIDHGDVRLYSRHGLDFRERYAPVVEDLEKIKHKAVLDGEVVVLDERGRSSFQALQDYEKGTNGHLVYEVFDVLEVDGKNLRDIPLIDRKRILKRMLPRIEHVRFSDHVQKTGIPFFARAKETGLEGIMAKEASSPYREGVRGREWLKIKTKLRQEVVVGGFTQPRNSREAFGALVVGVYDHGELKYAGHVGGGFSSASLHEAEKKLRPLVQSSSPFSTKIKTNMPVQWVKPVLVGEVEFTEWTKDGSMRHPIFVGWREDKPANEVVRERAGATVALVSGRRAKHTDKLFWPREGYTKGDMVAYYRDVAAFILPYLKDRPVSLNRHPNGIEGKNFFQKNVSNLHLPDFVETLRIRSESRGTILAPLIQNEESLLYFANLACIEMNPWNSRREHLDKPDYVIIDLDPEDVSFEKVIEVALAVHRLCEDIGIMNVCKTSGGRGLHIYIPMGARYSYEQARRFVELLAVMIQTQLPNIVSLQRSPAKRQGRVYLDVPQNKRGATNVCVYSLRPRPGATVSMPLRWSEVRHGLHPAKFTIRTVRSRLDNVGDLFLPILGPGVDLTAILRRLANKTRRE